MKRRVCVVTGTRAEYGLLRLLMRKIAASPVLELQVVATGMHLSPEFGLTYREIERDGFTIDRKVETLASSDTAVGIATAMGVGLVRFADVLAELRPDLVVVLGDRFEVFSAVAAALVARIPVAHLHGGEATEGLIDEAIRHSITKMSHLHFVAAEEYRQRVVQLGEQPERVFLVGGLGVDSIRECPLMDRAELEASLGIKWQAKNLLITFHPVTLEQATAAGQMEELLAALARRDDTLLLFTLPNADTGGRILIEQVRQFVADHANAHAFTSLGQRRYLSCAALVDAVVGNSSSGLTEAPTFKTGTINIGERQRGRLQAASVLNCDPDRRSIAMALERLYSPEFQAELAQVRNPYGDGGASGRIVSAIESVDLGALLKKNFFNLR